MSEFSQALKGLMGINVQINTAKVIEIIGQIVAAAPAIEKGIVTIEPFVQAIVTLVEHGGDPTPADWAQVQAGLDANSAAIAAAAKQAESELASSQATSATSALSASDTSVAGEAALAKEGS